MRAVRIAILCCLSIVAVSTTSLNEGVARSAQAKLATDPRLGQTAIFRPVTSCLSDVVLVIYIQSLEMLKRLNTYTDMYGRYFAAIEFYVDGTWCDPRLTHNGGYPCYGAPLDRSIVPENVRVVDRNGGGWMMQRSLINATSRHREGSSAAGFLFITDDVLLNLGQLTRAANVSGCAMIWRSDIATCADVGIEGSEHLVFLRFLREARHFYKVSEEGFRSLLARNLGTPSTYCMGTQNDFIYIPSSMAEEWTKVAYQMTECGLPFTFSFFSAIFGISRIEDMVVLRTKYLSAHARADHILAGATFKGGEQPYCWQGEGGVGDLLRMHIIHPNKVAHSRVSSDFARTLNLPNGLTAMVTTYSEQTKPSGALNSSDIAASPFWCSE